MCLHGRWTTALRPRLLDETALATIDPTRHSQESQEPRHREGSPGALPPRKGRRMTTWANAREPCPDAQGEREGRRVPEGRRTPIPGPRLGEWKAERRHKRAAWHSQPLSLRSCRTLTVPGSDWAGTRSDRTRLLLP